MDKLNNSVRTSEVDPKDFVALFVPGGHGSPPEPVSCCLPCLCGQILTLYSLRCHAVCCVLFSCPSAETEQQAQSQAARSGAIIMVAPLAKLLASVAACNAGEWL